MKFYYFFLFQVDVWHWPFLLRGSRPSGEMSIDWNVSWPVNESKNLKSWEDFKIELAASSDQPQSGYCRTRAGQPVRFLINICHGSNICPFSFSSQLTNIILTVSVEQVQYHTDACSGTGINNLFFSPGMRLSSTPEAAIHRWLFRIFFLLFTLNRKYC